MTLPPGLGLHDPADSGLGLHGSVALPFFPAAALMHLPEINAHTSCGMGRSLEASV